MSEIWGKVIKKWKEQFYAGFCAICGYPLEDVFPDDYPNDWKFCCSCLSWANFILEENIITENILLEDKLHRRRSLITRIYEKITIVG